MSTDRMARVNELILRELSQLVYRLVQDPEFDVSAITFTRVSTSPNLRNAIVMVSVRGDEGDQDLMINILRRHRTDFQRALAENVTIKYTPRLSFKLDHSVELGDNVLGLLAELDSDESPDEDDTES